jgi:opacity protein-like surface antigen
LLRELAGAFLRTTILGCLALLIAVSAEAQSNDVGVTAGGYFAVSNPLSLGVAWALEGTFAHRIALVPLASLSAELAIAGSSTSSIPTINGTTLARSYTSLFITPGLRLRLAPSFPVTPYLAVGVGLARFNRRLNGGATSANTTAAFDIGGGLDIKLARFISLRGELRDFNSGGLGLQTLVGGRQNNLFATVGLALRF